MARDSTVPLLSLLLLLCLLNVVAGYSSTGNVLETKVTRHSAAGWGGSRGGPERYYFSLKHRDAPNSPFAQQYKRRNEFLQAVLYRDGERARSFLEHIAQRRARQATGTVTEPGSVAGNTSSDRAGSPPDPSSGATVQLLAAPAGAGEYYTELYVGTPRQLQVAMVDFASDVVWFGEPTSRFRKRITYGDPDVYSHFYPSSSSSYTPIPAASTACVAIEGFHVCGDKGVCRLVVGIGEDHQAYIGGVEFAYEDIRVNRMDQQKGSVMGRIVVSVSKVRSPTGGILGLGLGQTSFASQMANRNESRFSYCLSDTDEPSGSSLIFGAAGDGEYSSLEFTPLVTHPHVSSFYFVNLLAVAVDGVQVRRMSAGAVLDMSTRFTRLPQSDFHLVVEILKARIALPTTVAPVAGFHLCYSLANSDILRVPSLTLTFQGGARMKLPMENLFVAASEQGDSVMCLAVVPGAPGSPTVIGSTQQQNFLIVVDRARSRLGFAPRQCASLPNS